MPNLPIRIQIAIRVSMVQSYITVLRGITIRGDIYLLQQLILRRDPIITMEIQPGIILKSSFLQPIKKIPGTTVHVNRNHIFKFDMPKFY